MNRNFDRLKLSSNPDDMDMTYIVNYLKTSYWAESRTVASIEKSLKNSFCFSLLLENEQIGFARVVTDQIVFAYLMDVFIDPVYQGNGYGNYLLDKLLKDPILVNVECIRLATKDAHPFYLKKGFKKINHPEFLMEKKQ